MKVKGQQLIKMVHAVRTKMIDTTNKGKALSELQTQNLQLKYKVNFLKLTCEQKTLKATKLYMPLPVDIRTQEEAGTLVQNVFSTTMSSKTADISVVRV